MSIGEAAQADFLRNLSTSYLATVRQLRVNIHISILKGEIPPEVKDILFEELMAMAALVQREVGA